MDVASNSIIANQLPMPHSPRLYEGKLFVLLSASGEVALVDPDKGTYGTLTKISGFVRGLDRYGDYLFVGISKLRQNSSTFKHLPIAEFAKTAGFHVIHIPTATTVAKLEYLASVDEIYDVQVLEGVQRPGILNTIKDVHKRSLHLPESTFWAREVSERS